MYKIGFISLGCPKALVDSENILTYLKADGYPIVDNYSQSDVVIINTCGFIESAVEESLNTIGEALNENGKVIVTGCLGVKESLILDRYPKVLGVTGPNSTEDVLKIVYKHFPKEKNPFIDLVPITEVKLTPKHYSYLKISEGCNNTCTFCIIPSLRGKLNSYSVEDTLRQAEKLVKSGTKELLIISQDTSAYGSDMKYKLDFYNGRPIKTSLYDLCNELGKLGVWIRLHYVYPYPSVDKIVELMAQKKILPYLDIPFQHGSPRILKLMKRPGNIDNILNRIAHWREICPEIAIRSTFIVGFPGETEEDFKYLLDFLRSAQLDRVGCFKYSPVDGAVANSLDLEQVDEDIKDDRYERFMQCQMEISKAKLSAKVGKELEVIIDDISGRKIIGRTKFDAPEIDGLVYIKQVELLNHKKGDIIKVLITDSNEYDLFGKVIVPIC